MHWHDKSDLLDRNQWIFNWLRTSNRIKSVVHNIRVRISLSRVIDLSNEFQFEFIRLITSQSDVSIVNDTHAICMYAANHTFTTLLNVFFCLPSHFSVSFFFGDFLSCFQYLLSLLLLLLLSLLQSTNVILPLQMSCNANINSIFPFYTNDPHTIGTQRNVVILNLYAMSFKIWYDLSLKDYTNQKPRRAHTLPRFFSFEIAFHLFAVWHVAEICMCDGF